MMSEVAELYKKVNVDPNSVASDHRILVYRFKDSDGKNREIFLDDGEHGAGRRLMQYMRVNKIINVGVVITSWSGGIHLGLLSIQDYGGTHLRHRINNLKLF